LVKGLRFCSIGPVEIDSMPPARMARLIPAAICPAPIAIADRLDAHWRFTAIPGMSTRPRATAM
jgi:hypothetical protein